MNKRSNRDRGRKGNCWRPAWRAIIHQNSPPSPPHWKNKTVSWHGGGGELQGGKLGNQMWSIKNTDMLRAFLCHTHTLRALTHTAGRHACVTQRLHEPHTHTHKHTNMPSWVYWKNKKSGQSQATMCVQSVMQNHISKIKCLKHGCLRDTCTEIWDDFWKRASEES